MSRSILVCASLALVCTLTACAPKAAPEVAPAETAGDEQATSMVDPVAASPDIFTLLVESERVRVIRATWQPGQTDKLHGHRPLVAYALTDIVGQLTAADGTVKPVKIKAGSALLEGHVTAHTFQNLGTEPAQMLLVEPLK